MTLDRYIGRMFLTRTLGACVILICLVQILELLDTTSDIFSRGLGWAGLGRYSLLRVPGMFEQTIQLSVLIGSVFTFTQLSRTSEMVVIRATGANIYRVLRIMIPIALIFCVTDLIVSAEVAPRSQAALARWWKDTTPAAKAKAPNPHWFRLGRDLVSITTASEDGRRLNNVRIYRRDGKDTVQQEIIAAAAVSESTGIWRLTRVHTLTVANERALWTEAPQAIWRSRLKPVEIATLMANNELITASTAVRALIGLGALDKSPGYYATRLLRTFAEPLGVIVMLLLAAPAALANLRSDQAVRLMLFGIISGLLFMVADGVLTAIGEASGLPPILAALGAPLIFTALALTVLLYAEG